MVMMSGPPLGLGVDEVLGKVDGKPEGKPEGSGGILLLLALPLAGGLGPDVGGLGPVTVGAVGFDVTDGGGSGSSAVGLGFFLVGAGSSSVDAGGGGAAVLRLGWATQTMTNTTAATTLMPATIGSQGTRRPARLSMA